MHLKTPLHAEHLALGAKMCPFAGYDMPINYALGVIKEHEWTRERAGMFDVSHMGQAMVEGAAAAEFFSRITPSNFSALSHNVAKYTVLTNERGGIIDDLIITRVNDTRFFVVFNAGRKAVDIAWMKQHLPAGVSFTELADNALIALQGPRAESVLAKEMPTANLPALGYMRLIETQWRGVPVIVSRLGYTGEDGFEISVPAAQARDFWNALKAHADVEPIGLAARDSLRLEMGYPLYGHDLTEEISPVEAALSWVISKNHSGFIGGEIVLAQAANGQAKKRIGVKLLEAGVAREGAAIYLGDQKIGALTSGGFSPSLKASIGQGYVDVAYANISAKVAVEVRGRKIAAELCALSFLPAKTKQPVKKAS